MLVCVDVVRPDMATPKTAGAARGTIHGTVFSGLVTFTIRAIPLPPKITEFLLNNTTTMAKMLSQRGEGNDEMDEQDGLEAAAGTHAPTAGRMMSSVEFWTELEGLMGKPGGDWAGAADRIWCFGPKRLGANVLLDPPNKSSLR